MEGKEYRVFGPPGTGKTTFLTRWIKQSVEKHGRDSLIVASFTKAAARELVGRDLPIDIDRCTTLHSHCYRSLGNPKIAETKIAEFNERNPDFAMSTGTQVNMDEGEFDQKGGCDNDDVFNEYQVMRAKLVSEDHWTQRVKYMAKRWEDFKFKTGYMDFNDLIEKSIGTIKVPDGAIIGIFDEVQDFTPLQLKLVRYMGKQLEYSVLAGDDDQTIYGFTGASPTAFLEPELPQDQVRVLNQSYRVPRKVQVLAEEWIKKVKRRQVKEYKPRDFEGEIRRIEATSKKPNRIVEIAEENHNNGRTTMILASCGYMLQGTLARLRERGLPFHNPYKISRGDWNPLGRTAGVSTRDRLVAFLTPTGPKAGQYDLWTPAEINTWIDLVHVKGLLTTKSRDEIRDIAERQVELTQQQLITYYTKWFTQQGLNEVIERSLDYIEKHVVKSKEKAIRYPINVIYSRGVDALREKPKICVGTIHSVKGGQADAVVLMPNLSINAAKEIGKTEGFEAIVRQFYVGMTRCREELIITADDSGMGVRL